MKLLLMSDLHFCQNTDSDYVNEVFLQMKQSIQQKNPSNDEIFCIILGDLVDGGGSEEKFALVRKFLDLFRTEFKIKFLFLPGNHEIEKSDGSNGPLRCYNDFAQKESIIDTFEYCDNSGFYQLELEGFHFILLDSTRARDYRANGEIDIEGLKNSLAMNKKSLIFMHHPPSAMAGGDSGDKCIVNSTDFMDMYKQFVFYGHVHGAVARGDYTYKDTSIHAVGSLLVKHPKVKAQFLFIDLSEGRVNYLYRYTRTQKDFTPEIIYPYKNLLTSSDVVEYKPIKNKNTIHRRFKRKEQDVKTETGDIWEIASENYQGLLLDKLLIRKENLILLQSKAGMGKTFTLSDMYHFLLDGTQYFPLFLKLRSSTLEKIKEYLEYIRNNFINNKIPFLLLDGLDEFPSDKVSELIREISSAIQGEPEAKILVTTRENAISSENDFISYELSPFSAENMKEFAKNEHISDIAGFIECIEKKDLMELAIIPFYLKLMTKIFFETNTLTTKDELIDQVISLRLQEGTAPSILENQYKIEEGLKDLALILQVSKCFMLDNRSYTRLFDSEIQSYFQGSNLIVRKKESGFIFWEFEHNIFREYLVASVLTILPLKEIVGLVTVKEGTILRGSYEKILEIFLLTDKSEDFTQFLFAKIPLSLATVNAINLTEEQKFEVAMYFITHNPYENANYDDYEKFSHYYSSKKVMDYYVACIDSLENMELLNRIFGVLYHSDYFYGMESMLFDEIIQIYRTEHWECLRYRAMYALRSILRYSEFKDLDKLMLITTENDYKWNADMTASIIPILSDSSSCDEYCGFILKYIETPVNNGVTHLHTSYLETILRKISHPDNLIMLTRALRKTSAKHTYGKNDLFEIALQEWNRFYERTCDKMYPALVKELCEASQDMDNYGLNKLVSFVQTKKPVETWLFDFVKSEDSETNDAWFLNHFTKDQYVDTILHCYHENYISSENLTRYSNNFTPDSNAFLKIKVALLEKDNISLSDEIPQTYEEQKREVAQKFFDFMFPPEQLEEMLKELVSLYPEDALCSEWEMEHLPEGNPQYELLKYLKDILFRWYYHYEGDRTTKLRDVILDENFLNYQKYNIIQEHPNLIITKEQRKWYKIFFETLLKDFDNCEVNKENYQNLRSQADILLFLAHHFDFHINDDILGVMLYLTPIVLKEPFRGCYSSGYEVIEVLVQEKELFQKAVLRNLEGEQEMFPGAIDTHLAYCKRYHLTEGIPLATNYFHKLKTSENNRITDCVSYLLEFKGTEYVDSLLDDTVSDDVLKSLVYYLSPNSENLLRLLEERNKNSESGYEFFYHLLKMRSDIGFSSFIIGLEADIDSLSQKFGRFMDIGREIEEIRDFKFLPYLERLFPLACAKDFPTNKFLSLGTCVCRAFRNLMAEDFQIVENSLRKLLHQHEADPHLEKILYRLLQELDFYRRKQLDIPLSEKEALEIIDKIKKLR